MTANITVIMLNVYVLSDITSHVRFTQVVGDYDGKHQSYHVKCLCIIRYNFTGQIYTSGQ